VGETNRGVRLKRTSTPEVWVGRGHERKGSYKKKGSKKGEQDPVPTDQRGSKKGRGTRGGQKEQLKVTSSLC